MVVPRAEKRVLQSVAWMAGSSAAWMAARTDEPRAGNWAVMLAAAWAGHWVACSVALMAGWMVSPTAVLWVAT